MSDSDKYRKASADILQQLRSQELSYGEACAVLSDTLDTLQRRSKTELNHLPLPDGIEILPTFKERLSEVFQRSCG